MAFPKKTAGKGAVLVKKLSIRMVTILQMHFLFSGAKIWVLSPRLPRRWVRFCLSPFSRYFFLCPDTPACAFPVQAASRIVPFRLGAVQGFSILPYFVTPFLKMGIKKAVNFSLIATSQRSVFRYSVVYVRILLKKDSTRIWAG